MVATLENPEGTPVPVGAGAPEGTPDGAPVGKGTMVGMETGVEAPGRADELGEGLPGEEGFAGWDG